MIRKVRVVGIVCPLAQRRGSRVRCGLRPTWIPAFTRMTEVAGMTEGMGITDGVRTADLGDASLRVRAYLALSAAGL
jgi:hypothetical protein